MLTVHVGLHKTGSTAIQNALSGMTREELRGIHYRGLNSAAGNDKFFESTRDLFQVPPRADRSPTVQLLRAGHHVVLSHETFLGHPWLPDTGEMYRHAVSGAAAMRSYFHDRTPFQIVIYLRTQNEWLESLYNQYAKSTAPAVNSTQFAERAMEARNFRWAQLISDLKEEVGPDRLIVRPYHPGINVTADFLTILALPTPQRLLQTKRENPSRSPGWLSLQQQLHDLLETAGDPDLLSWARMLDNGRESGESNADYSMFTEDTQSRLIEITASDWEYLPKVVADTHLAEPHRFESLAKGGQQARIKPYFGSLDKVSASEEAVRLLIAALPYVRTHPRNLPTRVKAMAARIRTKVQADSKDLSRETIAFLRRQLT